MAVFHLNPDDLTADYYAPTTGESVEEKIAAFKDWATTPEPVRKGWLEVWESEQGTEETVEASVENIAVITKFLKGLSARATPSEAARKALILEVFAAPLKKLTEDTYTSAKTPSKKIDAIDAVREAVGTSYGNISTWFDEKDDKGKSIGVLKGYEEVKAEFDRRQAAKGK